MNLLLLQLFAGLTSAAAAGLSGNCVACYADIFPAGADVICALPWVQSAITDCSACAQDLATDCNGTCATTFNDALGECVTCEGGLTNVADLCGGGEPPSVACSACALALAKQCGDPAPTACAMSVTLPPATFPTITPTSTAVCCPCPYFSVATAI